ncbi:hypothetical protein UNSWCS_502 [Campylobacter concisus UNSWCS]|uniref:Uncharacterized protein n=1 Tax=Campylobacter concisus UNSWCS TaxID=1242968 RepID=U2GIJ4_9BACT|nr:hypothetical protein UNSWCS_502 [Campylobacter concisus UNSWCS]
MGYKFDLLKASLKLNFVPTFKLEHQLGFRKKLQIWFWIFFSNINYFCI